MKNVCPGCEKKLSDPEAGFMKKMKLSRCVDCRAKLQGEFQIKDLYAKKETKS